MKRKSAGPPTPDDQHHQAPKRILLLNPNTNTSMTTAVETAARPLASANTTLVSTTARLGVHVICSRVGVALAGHAALDAYAAFIDANRSLPLDGVVLACFGAESVCLEALRDISKLPCVGMAEAGCLAAAKASGSFSIVTGGCAWGPMLREYAQSLGLGSQLASVRVLPTNGAEIAAKPVEAADNIYQAARSAVEEDGAELILLAGAGMVGQVGPLQRRLGVPVMDGLAPAMRDIEAAIAAKPLRPSEDGHKSVRTKGLLPELEKILASGTGPPRSNRAQ
jgi:Asp/Glu/hydantoin racemase